MRRSGLLLLLVSAVAIAAVVVAEPKGEPDVSGPQRIVASAAPEVGFESAVERAEAQAPEPPTKLAARFGLEPETVPLPVVHEFKDPPKAGLMFDVGTGEILWSGTPTASSRSRA